MALALVEDEAAGGVTAQQARAGERKGGLPAGEIGEQIERGAGGNGAVAVDIRPVAARGIRGDQAGVLDHPVARRENPTTGGNLAVLHSGDRLRVSFKGRNGKVFR